MDLWGKESERRFFTDKHWREPLRWDREASLDGERRRVFCASMADVFEDRKDLVSHRTRLWKLIEATPNLDWLLLTKRAHLVKKLAPGPWPANAWIGTTAENQQWFDIRVHHILDVPAPVRFLSCEPLLGAIDARPVLSVDRISGINWVIAGGESGPKARPYESAWFRDLRDQCAEVGVPFHFKQWGTLAPSSEASLTISGETEKLVRLGKKAAGRQLDGRTWDGFPRVDDRTGATLRSSSRSQER